MQLFPLLTLAQEKAPPTFLEQLRNDPRQALTSDEAVGVFINYGSGLLAAIAVFVFGRWLAKIVTAMVVRAGRRAKVDETLLGFLHNVVYLVLLIVVCIAALGCLGVNTTSLSAMVAAAGFAVGMALQGSLGNIASGVMLVVFKPFQVGDYVELAGTSGTVVSIHMFSTILVKPDNVRVIVPNGNITGSPINNYSAENIRRVDLVIGCGYNDDLPAVRRFLEDTIAGDPRILQDPAPVVAVSELADSSVNFVVRPWVTSENYWAVKFDLTERIKLGFDEHGFTIPYPSRDVFMHQSGAA